MTANESEKEKSAIFSRGNLFLYSAYLSTCLEDRAWSFCVALSMQLTGGLRVVSIEQLLEGLLQIFVSGYLGKILDELSRKQAIMIVVPINNLSICLAAGLLITCLSVNPNSTTHIICLMVAMLTCSINRLFLNGEKLLVGRDWAVALGDQKTLARLNATLTTIDQVANVIAPILTGALVTWFDLRITIAIFGIASLVSLASKMIFLTLLYNENEVLREEKVEKDVASITSDDASDQHGVICSYFYQTAFPAALGLALLFMTVLGFDGLAVGYGSSVGLPEWLLGAFRSLGSLAGILGAISYAIFERQYSVATSGIIGLAVQQTFAILAVVSIWLKGSPMDLSGYFRSFTIQNWWHDMLHTFDGSNSTNQHPHIDWQTFTSNGVSLDSIFVFLIAIACARYGLWCLDLAITHIMQLTIPETERNAVFGVHNSLCQSFSVLKDLMVIVLPQSSTFGLCILISYGFTTAGHAFFIYYLIKSGTISTVGRRLSELSTDLEEGNEEKT